MEPKLTVSEHEDAHLVIGALRLALRNCQGNIANVQTQMDTLTAEFDQLLAHRTEGQGVERKLEALIAAAEKSHDSITDRETLANERPLEDWEKELLNIANGNSSFVDFVSAYPADIQEKLKKNASYGKLEPKDVPTTSATAEPHWVKELREQGITVIPVHQEFFPMTGNFFD